MLAGAIAIIVMLSATAVFSLPITDKDCPSPNAVQSRFDHCIESNHSSPLLSLFSEQLMGQTVITNDDIITGVGSMCRQEGYTQEAIKCVDKISFPSCPRLTYLKDYVTNNINARWAVFCEGNQISTWLHDTLQNGFMFNRGCVHPNSPVVNVLRNCSEEAQRSEIVTMEDKNTLPTDQVLSLLQEVFINSFWCTINRANEEFLNNNVTLDCGNTWQDIILAFWLHRTAVDDIGPLIGPLEIEALKAMKST